MIDPPDVKEGDSCLHISYTQQLRITDVQTMVYCL